MLRCAMPDFITIKKGSFVEITGKLKYSKFKAKTGEDKYVTEIVALRMHSDAQFAGSSSVPAHVEMMGFLGMGNNPMVGATVAVAVDVSTALNK